MEEGLHHDAFDAVHREICLEQSVNYWTRELINAYKNILMNIYISEGEIDGHFVDVLEDFLEGIESKDLKVYALVWEVNNNGEIVYTKDGKVVLNNEPSAMLLRMMGNQMNEAIFMMVERGTSRSLRKHTN